MQAENGANQDRKSQDQLTNPGSSPPSSPLTNPPLNIPPSPPAPPPPDDNVEKSAKQGKKRMLRILRKVIIFIFSQAGLSFLVIGYATLGGLLFQYLEGKSEKLQMIAVEWRRNKAVAELWNMTADLNVVYQKNWSHLANQILKDFQQQIVYAVRDDGWNGREANSTDVKWSFPGALLYCITILTTIGYGNITPKTVPGRLATILYALIGIPLTLLWISLMGSGMAKSFRFIFSLVKRFIYKSEREKVLKNPKHTVRVPLFVSLFIILGYIASGSLLFCLWEEEWDYLTAAYFCFTTLTTIGFGDFVFGIGKELDSNAKLVTCALYLVLGLALIAMCFDLMQEETKTKLKILGRKLGILKRRKDSLEQYLD